MDDNNKKWRLEKIKSIRVSPELLTMIEREAQARNTSFSSYARYCMTIQMKYGNKPEQQNAA
jgi:hypothetical protein